MSRSNGVDVFFVSGLERRLFEIDNVLLVRGKKAKGRLVVEERKEQRERERQIHHSSGQRTSHNTYATGVSVVRPEITVSKDRD